jgi:hypothetical protein
VIQKGEGLASSKFPSESMEICWVMDSLTWLIDTGKLDVVVVKKVDEKAKIQKCNFSDLGKAFLSLLFAPLTYPSPLNDLLPLTLRDPLLNPPARPLTPTLIDPYPLPHTFILENIKAKRYI